LAIVIAPAREISPMESRVELAIARQTEELKKAIRDQDKFYRCVTLGVLGASLAVVAILFKVH